MYRASLETVTAHLMDATFDSANHQEKAQLAALELRAGLILKRKTVSAASRNPSPFHDLWNPSIDWSKVRILPGPSSRDAAPGVPPSLKSINSGLSSRARRRRFNRTPANARTASSPYPAKKRTKSRIILVEFTGSFGVTSGVKSNIVLG